MRSNGGKSRALTVGLTGGFGSGKSTVLAMFRRKGAGAIDADAIVHRLLKSDARVKRAIRRRFGDGVFSGGAVVKRALADRIFTSTRDRRDLEAILHPAVRRLSRDEARRHRGKVAVVDVPLLFEKGWKKDFDLVMVVATSLERRRRRLSARGFSRHEIARRFRAQWPLSRKTKLADVVINNDGPRERTKKQIDLIWNQITNHPHVVRGTHGLAARK